MEASDADLRAVLGKVKQQNPEVLFSTVVGGTARNFYRLLSQAGFEPGLCRSRADDGGGEVVKSASNSAKGTIRPRLISLRRPRRQQAFRGRFPSRVRRRQADQHVECGRYAQVRLFASRWKPRDARYAASRRCAQGYPMRRRKVRSRSIRRTIIPAHSRIGRLRKDGVFDIVWQAKSAVKPTPISPYTPWRALDQRRDEAS